MELRADSDGFLIGGSPVDLKSERDSLALLRAIKADTAAMRKALSRPGSVRSQVPPEPSAPQFGRVRVRQAANSPILASDAAGSRARPVGAPVVSVRSGAPESVAPAEPAPATRARPLSAGQATPVAIPRRAKNGRFVARGGAHDAEGGEPRAAGRVLGKLDDLISGMRDSFSGLFADTEQVDPAIAAAKEVGDLVTPLAAPIKGVSNMLFGSDDDKAVRAEQSAREHTEKKIAVPWYRRLWSEIRELNEGRGGQASRRVSLGGVGGLLMKLPGIGMLGKLGGAIQPVLKLLGRAALPLTALFSAVQSFGTSTEEYAKRLGVTLDGSLAQELGVRFVGVLGDLGNTLTFGLAGKFGEYIAPAVSQMVEGVVGAWTDTTAWFEAKWSGITEGIESTWAEVTGKFDSVIDGISKWFADKFGSAVDKVKAVGSSVATKAGDVKESAGNWVAKKSDQVASAFGGGSKGRRQAVQRAMLEAGITDPREQAMFMAQMDHESGGFMASEESFNYRSADRLMAVSGSARKHGKAAVQAAMDQGPEAVAELMYGGRMGNTEKGDAYRYRGRGAIQLTGKDNYAAASKALGVDLLANPEMAADPEIAGKVATWYWQKNGLGEAARKGDVTGVTRKINGGTNGLADRKAKYEAYLAAATTGKLSIEGGRATSQSVQPAAPKDAATSPATTVPPLLAPVRTAATETAKSAAPSAAAMVVPPVPSVPRKVASNDTKTQQPVVLESPLTQNLADRGLAQAATGGIGMSLGAR